MTRNGPKIHNLDLQNPMKQNKKRNKIEIIVQADLPFKD